VSFPDPLQRRVPNRHVGMVGTTIGRVETIPAPKSDDPRSDIYFGLRKTGALGLREAFDSRLSCDMWQLCWVPAALLTRKSAIPSGTILLNCDGVHNKCCNDSERWLPKQDKC
jgi:hypothetical protein